MTPEGEVKREIDEYYKQTLVWPEFHLRLQAGKLAVRRGYMHLCPEGTADFLVCKTSGTIWVEVKKPGKDTTSKARAEKQAKFRERVLALGHRHIIARSVVDL